MNDQYPKPPSILWLTIKAFFWTVFLLLMFWWLA